MSPHRYPLGTWRGQVVNHGGPLGPVRFFVVHVMQGTLAGTDAWFHEARAQVSAHFGVGRDGQVLQWVDVSTTAWAEMAYNDRSISIEHEGYSGEVLTRRQLAASTDLLRWLAAQFPGVPLQRTADPNGRGVIGHGELGVLGGDHPDCPGTPILHQLNVALRTRTVTKRVITKGTK